MPGGTQRQPAKADGTEQLRQKNRQGTTLGNTLLLRYLKNAKYVKNAAASKERRKFLAMVDVFRKYGDRYDVDWLLMAAQDTRSRG